MDRLWLEAAFFQAKRALGNTGKNPAVGCVIVKDKEIIGIGHTSFNGRPHAEENALKMAGKRSKGATLYVTLEPCNKDDNSNSCTIQILKSGIKKVVFGVYDPNIDTYKKGIKALEKAGVKTLAIKTSFNNFLVNYPHICYHKNKRPVFTLKLGTSLDGKITYRNGQSKWITSDLARKHLHQIRSMNDAILVGSNTFKKDNPSLDSRIENYKSNNFRVIFDKDLSLNLRSNLVKNIKKNPLIIFTKEDYDDKKYKKFYEKGIKIYPIEKDNKDRFNLKKVSLTLYELGIQKVLVEGGAKVASSFLNKNLIDLIYIYKSNKIIGKNGLHAFDDMKCNNNFYLYNVIDLEDNRLEVWVKKSLEEAEGIL